ncbi:MAG: TolC family protein [Bdellovibrionaceae bacterium]|jgi:multidrug efflux pump subunit AcrB/outer membrane protein TolC|nr:TolC family protein [Pseudobdellovibrionaceae bacterium]
MKEISLYFIRRPILVNFILVLNFALGGYFLYKIPKESFPAVSMNQIIVVTKYPGASARDVELNLTTKIEDRLSEIGKIREFRSSSIESVSRVTVFADDDLNELQFKDLVADVQTEIDKIDDFPADIDGLPIITSVTTEDRPIMEVAFTGEYRNLRGIVPGIERGLRKISGVSGVNTVGLADEEIHIEVDAIKALEKEIDLNTVFQSINARNQVGTGGTLESFVSQKKIVSFNKFEHADDVLNTIIRMSPDGQGVYLKDVAGISYHAKDEKLIVRNNGERGATILIAIRSGMDQLKVSDKLKAYLDGIKFPAGVKYQINNDVSDKARSKFDLLKKNGILGFVLVIILLFYFLGSRTAFWTAFGIPFSIFGSMILFAPLGFTLNSVSMGAFVIILGMIVDDAMVISERYDVNLENGDPPEEAASNAVGRLWKPVFAAALTTITAFLPLLSLGGLPGKFIWQMPVVVMIALLVSLIDCYILLPAHLAHSKVSKHGTKKNKLVVFWENFYEKVLMQLLDFRYYVVGLFVIIFMASAFVGAKKLRKDAFPQEASEGFVINMTLEKGVAPEKVESVVEELEVYLNELPKNELEGYTSRLGTHSASSLTGYGTEENLVTLIVYLTAYSDRDRTANNIIDDIKQKIGNKFSVKGYEVAFELMRVGPPLGEDFEIIVSSNDDSIRKKFSDKVIAFISSMNGVYDVKDDYIPGKDEINLKLDYKKVAQAGLTPADIIRTLRIAFDGQVVTDFTSVNETYDYRLRLNKKTRGDLDFISKLPIANRRGQLIKLETMIKYEEKPSYAEIKRFNGARSTSVTGGIDPNKVTVLGMLDLFKAEFTDTKDVKFIISGRPVEEAKIFGGLISAGLMAILGIYFILSLMFNSYSKPFLILAVIPFGIVGIFISFYFHGLPMSMFAGMGLIGLSGIVVNDSIVLIDHLSELIKNNGGFSKEVLVRAAKERLRPITLTTISTVLAVAPTAYAIGGYDNLLSPLSLAILYGLMFGTTVVLLFIPSLFYIGVEIGEKINTKKITSVSAIVTALLIFSFSFKPNLVQAEEEIGINEIVKILDNSNEYKVQNENIKQSKFQSKAVEGMLDGRISSKMYSFSSEAYPNPPITADSKKDSYGLSVDFSKMTSLGFKYDVGIGLEDRMMGTTPQNSQFSLDAMDSVYSAGIGIPLNRNFGSSEYYLRKSTAKIKEVDFRLKSKDGKERVLVDAVVSYWTLLRSRSEREITLSSIKRFRKIHELNKTKRKSGIISKSELLTSDVELINGNKTLAKLTSLIDIELIKFNRILEVDKKILLSQISPNMDTHSAALSFSDNELQDIIKKGYTTRLASNNEELIDSLINLEKEQEKSNVDLFVSMKSYGRGEDASASLSENTLDKYEVMAGLSWNFELGNTVKVSEIGKLLSRKSQARLKKNQLKKRLTAIYFEIKKQIQSNVSQVNSLSEIKEKQKSILKIEERRFKNGKITTLDYVKLQDAYDRSLLQTINLQYANELLAINLYKLLGRMDLYLKSRTI